MWEKASSYVKYLGIYLDILNGLPININITGPILESKGMGAIFQKKCKKMLKRGKIFENFCKNVPNLNIF